MYLEETVFGCPCWEGNLYHGALCAPLQLTRPQSSLIISVRRGRLERALYQRG